MKIILRFVFAFLVLSTTVFSQNNPNIKPEDAFHKKEVIRLMKKVADWQIADWKVEKPKRRKSDWINATGYIGMLSLYDVSGDKKYTRCLMDIMEKLNWQLGPDTYFADDYCIGQSYSILYRKFHKSKMIEYWQSVADTILQKSHDESLEWKNQIQLREWAWCDALFMGPPALAYLSTATSNPRYMNKACELWWKTANYLYDPEEDLFYRDSRYFTKRESNGAKVFWSRGNGWVLAGIVRMLENMPENHPDRPKFEALYKKIMTRIIILQQPDGSWHASLLDPQSYPVKECSGTAFFTYALLWGINHGLMDKEKNIQVVKKAWLALANSVTSDGKLGYVQPVGSSPANLTEESTDVYGVGAFLLAGSELSKLLKNNRIS